MKHYVASTSSSNKGHRPVVATLYRKEIRETRRSISILFSEYRSKHLIDLKKSYQRIA